MLPPAFAPRTRFDWQLRTRTLALGPRTRIMGILNVTPDSFSDGGRFASVNSAVTHALALLDEGAEILDIGGESTRPGATPLSDTDEQSRVLPVIEAILKLRPAAILSIDTCHAATARAAAAAGVEIVNDVSGLTWDPHMAAACAQSRCGVVLMHTRGRPAEWTSLPPIPPLARMPLVLTGLRDSILAARTAGVPSDRIVLDPGLGFGKLGDENYTILALLPQMLQFGLPILCGASRKGFLGRTLAHLAHPTDPPDRHPTPPPEARLHATTAANVAAILAGAHLLRVHDVRPAREAAAIADAILAAAAEFTASTGPAFAGTISSTPQ